MFLLLRSFRAVYSSLCRLRRLVDFILNVVDFSFAAVGEIIQCFNYLVEIKVFHELKISI